MEDGVGHDDEDDDDGLGHDFAPRKRIACYQIWNTTVLQYQKDDNGRQEGDVGHDDDDA